MAYEGELSALAASLLWSASSIPFTHAARRAGAIAVNAFKTSAAALLLVGCLAVTGRLGALAAAEPLAYLYIGLSGVIGLSLTDSLLFRSYALIGPRIAFLVFSTGPFFAALVAWPVLGERIAPLGLAGMALTVGGILLVTLGGTSPGTVLARRPQGHARGVWLAVLAALGMGVTSVLFKLGSDASRLRVLELLPAHAFRMAMGAAGLLVIGACTGRLRHWVAAFRAPRVAGTAAFGTLFGPVLGVWFFLNGVLTTPEVGVAMTLSSLTPVMVIPFTWCFFGDRPTVRSVLGAAIAVGGVALLFLR
ncbi:MAG: DMT family transporter [Planctomycetes bacterium]|nr:DMT family transporter [Planctomycetota bacterium]